jgi:hypothetical protein
MRESSFFIPKIRNSVLSLVWLAAFLAAPIGTDHADTVAITAENAIFPLIGTC